MGLQECMPDFSPFLDWQCPGCFALNTASAQHQTRSENSDEDREEEAAPSCGVCGGVAPPLYSSAVSTTARTEESGQCWSPDGSGRRSSERSMWDGGWEPGVTRGRTGSSYHAWRQPHNTRQPASRSSEQTAPVHLQQPMPQRQPVAADLLLRGLEEAAAAEMQPAGSKKLSSSDSAEDASRSADRRSSGSTESSCSNANILQRARQVGDQADAPEEAELRRLSSPRVAVGIGVAAGAAACVVAGVGADSEMHRPVSPAPTILIPEAMRAAGARRRSTHSPTSSAGAASSSRSGHAADCAAGRSARHKRK